MNEMYKYLKDHSYISENKISNYQFELSEERANCIACKYESLVEEENERLKENWNKLKTIAKSQSDLKQKCHNGSLWFEVDELLNKMQELEKSSSDE